ncbi:MAG: cytochrome C [Arcobacter sp.]|nr:MAG: cytochrome C [Arcobacter sp.]
MVFFTNVFAVDYGELLFNGNCITCHFKTKKVSAPSIYEIRENYLRAFPEEEVFVKYMSTWVLKPDIKTSIMQDSIEEFNIMPELGYDEYTLKEIARYLYKTDFSTQQK